MKIDEECINHNIVRLADEISSHAYEYENEQECRMALASIAGICDLARALKEVLDS